MRGTRARFWFSSVAFVAGNAAAIAACGPSDREIKAAVDSVTQPDSSSRAAAAAAAGDSAARAAAGDSAARADSTRPPAKQPR